MKGRGKSCRMTLGADSGLWAGGRLVAFAEVDTEVVFPASTLPHTTDLKVDSGRTSSRKYK